MKTLSVATLAAVSLVLVPTQVLAAPSAQPVRTSQSAAKLGLASRAAPTLGRHSALGGEGNNGLWIVGAVGLVAGVVYAFVRQHDQDNEEPASP